MIRYLHKGTIAYLWLCLYLKNMQLLSTTDAAKNNWCLGRRFSVHDFDMPSNKCSI